jgi:hypothetical protein
MACDGLREGWEDRMCDAKAFTAWLFRPRILGAERVAPRGSGGGIVA